MVSENYDTSKTLLEMLQIESMPQRGKEEERTFQPFQLRSESEE